MYERKDELISYFIESILLKEEGFYTTFYF
jgi:hypothetical protein